MTLNPQPVTLNPKPVTLNSKPVTVNPKPMTLVKAGDDDIYLMATIHAAINEVRARLNQSP